ncbi:AAA family ATPase [Enterococcus hirae]|uniref:AAA family ATPase n=1 Tax=Enterococcus hirae TaxID=1354 RepID=UPI00136B9EDC|nr:AAA family ATPase [Enterococcus hirae]NAE18220.1 AAA family ATPase [Enterococcus hirae]
MTPVAAPVALRTRKPTGKPPWPIILIAGAEKTGKSYACAAASASAFIDRTFWISVGEDDPDELGALPGARFEIVEHDGTYRGVLGAIDAAAAQPFDPAKPNMIVLDSATRLWDLIVDDAQAVANSRRNAKAGEDSPISMDLWNAAKAKWANAMTLLRAHRGPSLVTSRYDLVTVIERGKPTMEKEWKIKAEKSLPYDVGAVVEMPARGEVYLDSVRSLKFTSEPGRRVRYDSFSVENLWRDMGVTEPGATSERVHATAVMTNPHAPVLTEIGQLADQLPGGRRAVSEMWAEAHEGQPINQASDLPGLEALRDSLAKRLATQS